MCDNSQNVHRRNYFCTALLNVQEKFDDEVLLCIWLLYNRRRRLDHRQFCRPDLQHAVGKHKH